MALKKLPQLVQQKNKSNYHCLFTSSHIQSMVFAPNQHYWAMRKANNAQQLNNLLFI